MGGAPVLARGKVAALIADDRVIGAVSFYFTAPVNFDEEYTALLTSVAQHCAQALERARLYETAEQARVFVPPRGRHASISLAARCTASTMF